MLISDKEFQKALGTLAAIYVIKYDQYWVYSNLSFLHSLYIYVTSVALKLFSK